jgi:hypothetical protein
VPPPRLLPEAMANPEDSLRACQVRGSVLQAWPTVVLGEIRSLTIVGIASE